MVNTKMQLALVLVALALSARAEPPASEGEVQQAPVIVDGETLFSVRGLAAYPADRRAREIAGRIRALAANPSVGSSSITTEKHPPGAWITANGQRIMTVLDEDASLEETT